MDPPPVRVTCDAFVLLEKKSLFYSAKWQSQRLELSRELLEFSPRSQVVLRLRDVLFVVLRGFASADEAASSSNKQKLLLDVRSMEDVRKSWVYQTAAKTTRLDIYVDTEQTRDTILSFANSQSLQQQLPIAQLPEQVVPYAVPVAQVALSASDSSSSRVTSATNLNLLIEESFQALADAQEAIDRHPGNVDDALEKYRAADQGFERAASLVPDERTRQLFQERRKEIQKVIHRVEDTLVAQKRRHQPSARETLLMGITGMGFPDAPQHNVSTGEDTVSTSDSATTTTTTITNSAPATTSELDERLERLKNFAVQQEVERAQREHKPASEALRLRLQALRNEKHTTPSVESLEERFQRLRGGGNNANSSNASLPGDAEKNVEALFNRQSSVDRIIQQVQEEIALGIPDDELGEEQGSERDSWSSNSGSEEEEDDDGDEGSGDGITTSDRQRYKVSGNAASAKKSRR